jgi:hypothetical protein
VSLHKVDLDRGRHAIERFERTAGCAWTVRPFVTHAFERFQNGFERLRKLHQPHIGKFCARRQSILTLS